MWTAARLARAAHGPLVRAPLPGCCALPAAPRSEPQLLSWPLLPGPHPHPATLGSPAPPVLASGPLPRGPIRAPAAAAPAARAPPPPPGQPGLSPQINGLPDTPAPPVQCPASQSQTDTQRWRDRPVTGKTRNTRARCHIQTTQRPHHDRHSLWAREQGRHPGSRWEERQRRERERGRRPDMGPGVRGNILESRPRGWRPGRSPESQRQREQGQEEGRGGWQRQQQAKTGQLPHSGQLRELLWKGQEGATD